MAKFHPSMLNGHPGNITRACKRYIARAHAVGLVVTSTTDGTHVPGSYHYPRLPFRRKGHAVDVAPRLSVPHAERLHRMRAFQHAELKRGAWRYRELFGPTNSECVKNGRRITLANHSGIEDQHDTHCHGAPRI